MRHDRHGPRGLDIRRLLLVTAAPCQPSRSSAGQFFGLLRRHDDVARPAPEHGLGAGEHLRPGLTVLLAETGGIERLLELERPYQARVGLALEGQGPVKLRGLAARHRKAAVSAPGQSAWHISSAPERPPGAWLSGKKKPSQVPHARRVRLPPRLPHRAGRRRRVPRAPRAGAGHASWMAAMSWRRRAPES